MAALCVRVEIARSHVLDPALTLSTPLSPSSRLDSKPGPTLLRMSVTPGRGVAAMNIPVPSGLRLARLLMTAAMGRPWASRPCQPSVPAWCTDQRPSRAEVRTPRLYHSVLLPVPPRPRTASIQAFTALPRNGCAGLNIS